MHVGMAVLVAMCELHVGKDTCSASSLVRQKGHILLLRLMGDVLEDSMPRCALHHRLSHSYECLAVV